MSKFYKLKYNLPTFCKGDIAEVREDGNLWFVGNENPEIREKEMRLHWCQPLIMYNKKTLASFNILETYFDEMTDEEIEALWPLEGCVYWYITELGPECEVWRGYDDGFQREGMGNCFVKEEQADEVWQKIRLLANLRKIGFRMTSFSTDKKGGAYLTFDFPKEEVEDVRETLADLLGIKEFGSDND